MHTICMSPRMEAAIDVILGKCRKLLHACKIQISCMCACVYIYMDAWHA